MRLQGQQKKNSKGTKEAKGKATALRRGRIGRKDVSEKVSISFFLLSKKLSNQEPMEAAYEGDPKGN